MVCPWCGTLGSVQLMGQSFCKTCGHELNWPKLLCCCLKCATLRMDLVGRPKNGAARRVKRPLELKTWTEIQAPSER